jgi:arylsulfatase A-like enzyme
VTRPGQTIDAVTRNIDLAPTVASLTGAAPAPRWEGVDLTPLLRGETTDLDLPAFAETCYLFFPKTVMPGFSDAERSRLYAVEGATETLRVDPDFDDNLVLREAFHEGALRAKDRMVRTRRWKLIHIPGKDAPIYRLYDLDADPHQKVDLAPIRPPVMAALTRYVDAYWRGEAGPLRWPVEWEEAGPRPPDAPSPVAPVAP